MKLRALELEQFRKFQQPVRLSGFTDSLNLLCGPNELGKSTILAAIRGLLFERHNSKAEPIKHMQPWRGNAAPRLAMEFEIDGARWRIEKRFLHQPVACLTAPDGSRFDGNAAEEELQRLLGFGAAGKQGAKPGQMGMWGALWVTQRESVQQADLSSDLARATLTSCLDAEVGVLTGSEKGLAVIRAVREQLSRLVDGNGRPRGRYKEVAVALNDADTRLVELSERVKRLSEDTESFRQKNAVLTKVNDPEAEQQDQDALLDARRRKEAALRYQNQLDAARAEHALAQRNWEDAARERAVRATRADTIRSGEASLCTAAAATRDARESAERSEAALIACREAVAVAQARAAAAAQAARHKRALLETVRRAATLAVHETAIARAEALQGRVNGLIARLDAASIDEPRVNAVRKAARDDEAARAVLEAQATQIEFHLHAGAADRVSLGGSALRPEQRTLSIVEDVDIAVAEIGVIRVRPRIRDRTKLLRDAAAAAEHLRAALAAAGCVDAGDAERQWAERQVLERDLRDARAEITRSTPGDESSGLSPGLAALRDYVDVLRRRIREDGIVLEVQELPALTEVTAAVRRAEDEETAAYEALAERRSEQDSLNIRRTDAREGLATAEGKANAIRADLSRLRSEAEASEAREANYALIIRLADAEIQLAKHGADLAGLERARPLDTADGMQCRIERYERALTNRKQSISQLREEIAALRARIVQEGGRGLDEQIAASEREREALAQEHATCMREVRVLGLLLETLSAAERETKERYLAPVVRRVAPYLRSLFPGADIACDEMLRITGLTRDHLGTEDFERLSDGTQEQLAVLARLAFAEMLIDQGKPAMVILDDALAYSDAERIERMFDILTQASAKTQILILTCREDLFARLGGHRVVLTSANSTVQV
jgi:energy-coupling factor transporter ATP-binding protein EcfA2